MEWYIKGRKLEFEEENHIYRVDGKAVPSVTQLMKRKFGGKYDDVPVDVLRRAQEKGTQIHKIIECYCNGFDDNSVYTRNFKFLQRHYHFQPVESELPIILTFGGRTYAGRLDLILEIDGKKVLADIKTSYTLDREYLGHQLNLYRMGVEQSYDYKIDKLYGIHLREDVRKMVEIPIKGEKWLLKSLELTETK